MWDYRVGRLFEFKTLANIWNWDEGILSYGVGCWKDSGQEVVQDKGESMLHLIWWIVVGLIAGWATGKIMGGTGHGALMDIVIGIAGAIVGGWIMRAVGFAGRGGTIYTILVAIGGAIVLTLIYRLIIGRRGGGESGIRRAA
jgi:uncharacterized membrane protein YeaQ/YmgE (transglycosylase-associated protein family)